MPREKQIVTLDYSPPPARKWSFSLNQFAFLSSLLLLFSALATGWTMGLHNDFPLLPLFYAVFLLATPCLSIALWQSQPKARRKLHASVIIWFIATAIGGLFSYQATFGEDSHLTARRHNYCVQRLEMIGLAIIYYAQEHEGRFPSSLAELASIKGARPDAFICPAVVPYYTPAPAKAQVVSDLASGRNTHHIYLGAGLTSSCDPKMVIAHDNPANWRSHGGGMSVLFASGDVKHLDEKPAKRLLAELSAGHNPPRPGTVPGLP